MKHWKRKLCRDSIWSQQALLELEPLQARSTFVSTQQL